jgi:hypothetical protein
MIRLTVIALTRALVVAGCGGGEGGDPISPSGGPAKLSESKSECVAVPGRVVRAINAGARHGVRVERAAAYRSHAFENVYAIAGELAGPGVNGEVAVWAKSGNPRQLGGLILAVDAVAQEFSDWPAADTTDAAMTVTTHGVAEAEDCLRG